MSQIAALILFLCAITCVIFSIIGIFKPNIAFFISKKTRIKCFLFYFIIGFVCFIACVCFIINGPELHKHAVNFETYTQYNVVTTNKQEQNKQFNNEVNLPRYTIRKDDEIPGTKISFECVLEKPVDKATLTKLFYDIAKKYNTSNYENCFIIWMLPNYKHGQGAWATTHRMGEKFEVNILSSQDYK